MREQWYLCRVPWNGNVIRLTARDYRYMRTREENMRVRDPDDNLVLLAQGYEEEIQAYYDLINGGLTNVS
jgi:hypothetical protein